MISHCVVLATVYLGDTTPIFATLVKGTQMNIQLRDFDFGKQNRIEIASNDGFTIDF